jgi:hypothetical protein
MAIKLPTEIIKAETKSPTKLLIYSLPKSGKTSVAAKLPNSLIIDLEEGTKLVDSVHVRASNSAELREIVDALEEAKKTTGKKPYKYIIVDTATKLEEFADEIAPKLFQQTAMGSKFKGDIVELKALPMGAGYKYVRDAYQLLLNAFVPVCDVLILLGHTKDKYVTKDDKEVTSTQVDLSGKLAQLVSQNVDAIGYAYRKKNQLYLSFKTDGEIASGNRAIHLSGKDILLSESDADGNITAYWDKIFID